MAVLAPISGMPQFQNGRLVSGAVAYFYDAGTTTPRAVYEQASGSEHTQPVEVTGAGNFPAIYIQGSNAYKIRIEDGDGALIIEYDELQGEVTVSSGGGGEGTIIPAGGILPMYGTGAIDGWVRANGRTIGSSLSGGSERANSEVDSPNNCEALFLHLWDSDPNLAVSGGRGASAAADWAVPKTIALPSARGRDLRGLDDMGNSAAGALAGGTFTFGTAITLGAYGGAPTHTLTTAQLAAHEHDFTTDQTLWTYTGGSNIAGGSSHPLTAATGSGTTDSTGGGTAHNNLPPFLLITVYLKL